MPNSNSLDYYNSSLGDQVPQCTEIICQILSPSFISLVSPQNDALVSMTAYFGQATAADCTTYINGFLGTEDEFDGTLFDATSLNPPNGLFAILNLNGQAKDVVAAQIDYSNDAGPAAALLGFGASTAVISRGTSLTPASPDNLVVVGADGNVGIKAQCRTAYSSTPFGIQVVNYGPVIIRVYWIPK